MAADRSAPGDDAPQPAGTGWGPVYGEVPQAPLPGSSPPPLPSPGAQPPAGGPVPPRPSPEQAAPPAYGSPPAPVFGQVPPAPPYGPTSHGQRTYAPEPGAPVPPYGPNHVAPQTYPGGYPTRPPALPPGVQAADFGRRAAARIIDAVLIGVVFTVLIVALIVWVGMTVGFSEGEVSDADNVRLGVGFLLFLAAVLIGLPLYEIVLVAIWGATLGKKAVGIKVVRIEGDGTLRRPGGGPSFLRWLVPAGASIVVPGIGSLVVYLSPLFDSSGALRGWHDKVAGTYVVRT